MPLSEDKDPQSKEMLAFQRFETLLMQLLQRHTSDQKQIKQLICENQLLKERLQPYKELGTAQTTGSSMQQKQLSSTCNDALIQEINFYIKEIDACLSYFEQT
ncbi:MAG TPA: hypothetical protein VK133_03225 [Amoebophilaceae bacterium]|jgi:hypothetical protein|nr:hypothetical protein [Amoebophilaceae bacterium]